MSNTHYNGTDKQIDNKSWSNEQLVKFNSKDFTELQQKEFDYWVNKKWLVKNKFDKWVINSNFSKTIKEHQSEYIKIFNNDWKLAAFYLKNAASDNPLAHKCVICGRVLNPKYIKGRKPKTCSTDCSKELYKNTCLKKYGVNNPAKTEECIRKHRQTCLIKYGVNSYSKTPQYKERCAQINLAKYGTNSYTETEEFKEKAKQTKLEKYGDENYNNRDKAKQTYLNRYSVDNPAKSIECQEKIKNTNLKKYGVESYSQNSEFLEKIKQAWNSKSKLDIDDIKEKAKQTCLNKYGVEFYSQSPEFKEKIKQTYLEKYGVDNYTKTEECKEKIKQTCLKKYGVDSYSQSQEFLEKVKQTWKSKPRDEIENMVRKHQDTCLKKYGVDHYSKTNEFNKCHKGKYKYSDEEFDSSWELYFYIYHKEILKDNIIRCPEISFTYNVDGVEKTYHPDFMLFHPDTELDGELIEIKGTQFFKEDNNGEIIMVNPYCENQNKIYRAKYECMLKNNVKIITRKDILPVIKIVQERYGLDYIDRFKISKYF